MKRFTLAATLCLGLVVGCESNNTNTDSAAMADANNKAMPKMMMTGVENAVATVHGFGDSKVTGTVKFTQKGADVMVVADIDGLPANSEHGFHIHEFGDMSDAKGMSAGGHYNPEKHEHGLPAMDIGKRHPGDMGNLKADDKGHAHLEVTLTGISIAGDAYPILGRGVIVHEKMDDGGQPVGNAGARIAGGVIGVAK